MIQLYSARYVISNKLRYIHAFSTSHGQAEFNASTRLIYLKYIKLACNVMSSLSCLDNLNN